MKRSHLLSCLALTLSTFSLVGCNDRPQNSSDTSEKTTIASEQSTNPSVNNPIPVGDTPENALDWNGTYQGVLPCADCEGIKIELELNSDKTFELKETYLGKGQTESETEGTFVFDQNKPSVVILSSPQQQDTRRFFIGEGFAQALATDGTEITGELKDHYRLVKELETD